MKATFIITLVLAVSFVTCDGSFTKFFSHIKDKIKHHLHDHLWGIKHDHSSDGHHHTGQKDDIDETYYYTGKHVDHTKPPVVHELSTSTVEFTDSPAITKIVPTADGFPSQKEFPDQTQDENNNEQEISPDETIIDDDVIDPSTKYAVTEDDVITVATDNEDNDSQKRGDNDVKEKSSEEIDSDMDKEQQENYSAGNGDNASDNASQEYDESDNSFEEKSDEKNSKDDSSDMNSDDDDESEKMTSSQEFDSDASESSRKDSSDKDSSESNDSSQQKHSSKSSESSQQKHSSESSASTQDEDSVGDVSKEDDPTASGKMSSEKVDQAENSQEFPDQTKIVDEDIFPGQTTTDEDDVFPSQTSQSVDETDIPDQTTTNKDVDNTTDKDVDTANPCQDVICPNGMMCMTKELQCRYRSCPLVATCQALRPLSNFCGTPKKYPGRKCINNNMWFYNSAHGRCEKFVYSGCGYDPNVYATEYMCQNSCINKAVCQLAKATGPCRAAVPKWYYDVRDAKCKLFVYGGCAGNGNRFDNSKECSAICVNNN